MKKLTVIGIIGKTQGVNIAAKPPKKAKKKKPNMLALAPVMSAAPFVSAAITAPESLLSIKLPLPSNCKSKSFQ